MLKRQSKTALQFIFAGIMMMFIAIGCSDSSSTKETTTDTTVTDTTKMDTANTKPIVTPPDDPNK